MVEKYPFSTLINVIIVISIQHITHIVKLIGYNILAHGNVLGLQVFFQRSSDIIATVGATKVNEPPCTISNLLKL